MRRFFVIITAVWALLLPLGSAQSQAAMSETAGPVLLKVAKSDGLISTQLILTFTRLPKYRLRSSGQRIDLTLKGVEASSDLRVAAADSTLVDTLLARKPGELVVSFLVRRPPVKVTALEQAQQDQLILELKWARQSKARPAIAYKIDGSMQVDAATGAISRQPQSDFSGRWLDFFDEYRSPFGLRMPPRYSLPKLPLPAGVQLDQWPVEANRAYAASDWPALIQALQETDPLEGAAALVMAEAFSRTGQHEAALKLLKPQLSTEPESIYVRYLTGWLLAQSGDRFGALLQLTPLSTHPQRTPEWQQRIDLLQAEIALANQSLRRALRILEAEERWEPSLQPRRDLRLLDARAAQAKLVGAGAAYAPWLDGALIYEHPLSLGQAAVGQFRQRNFKRSKELLTTLKKQLAEPAALGMALYVEALTDDALDPTAPIEAVLHRIRLDAPESEASYRSWLLLIDRQVVEAQGSEPLGALAAYEEVARRALQRELREEASFKRALLLFISGRLEESIDALTAFRRGYQHGQLRHQAAAVLTEALPQRIRQLMDEGRDLQALVLVEQNRRLLLHSGLDMGFLHDLAQSMDRLGLWDRAVRVYLYMLDAAVDRPEFESKLYLPLIRLLYRNAQYEEVEPYCEAYFERYNEGDDRFRIYQLWVQARRDRGDIEGMQFLLGRPDRPSDSELEALACEIYWSLGDYETVQRLARRVKNVSVEKLARIHYLQAESLYRLERFRQANLLYGQLAAHAIYRDQSLYRRALIHRQWGQTQQARLYLQPLLEEKTDQRWQALAQDLLLDMSSN